MRLWWRLWLDMVKSAFGGGESRISDGAFGKNFSFSQFQNGASKGFAGQNWITTAQTGFHGDNERATGCITTGKFLEQLDINRRLKL